MFHWRDGITFERQANGYVQVNIPHSQNKQTGLTAMETMSIPPGEWASIVAAVALGGETTESYYAAVLLHMGNG